MDRKSDKDKKQILLRLSPTLWREIAAWAEEDFRSINGQIEYLLTECVRRRRRSQSESSDEVSDSGETPDESVQDDQRSVR